MHWSDGREYDSVFVSYAHEDSDVVSRLQKAYEERASLLVFLKSVPRFIPLRNDPRFADLVGRIGVP